MAEQYRIIFARSCISKKIGCMLFLQLTPRLIVNLKLFQQYARMLPLIRELMGKLDKHDSFPHRH